MLLLSFFIIENMIFSLIFNIKYFILYLNDMRNAKSGPAKGKMNHIRPIRSNQVLVFIPDKFICVFDEIILIKRYTNYTT